MSCAYLFDGSWEGLLTAVFESFSTKRWPEAVLPEVDAQLAFDQEAVFVSSDPVKARRVERGVVRRLGSAAHQKIWTAFLSGDPEKHTIIYRYICAGLEQGRSIYCALAHRDVLAIDKLCLQTTHEAQKLHGFIRLSRMDNGVFYSRISPNNNVLPLLMPFFADRYSDQPMLIFDSVHNLAGVYNLTEWYLVETDHIALPGFAEEEIPCRRLWKQFYHSIAIAQRCNPKCRRSNMPKRYWNNMTEFSFVEKS